MESPNGSMVEAKISFVMVHCDIYDVIFSHFTILVRVEHEMHAILKYFIIDAKVIFDMKGLDFYLLRHKQNMKENKI